MIGRRSPSMDADDLLPSRPDSPLALLAREDIDRLTVDELDARVVALQTEIERTQARRKDAVNHKATAEALFNR